MADMGVFESDDKRTEFRQRKPHRHLPPEHAALDRSIAFAPARSLAGHDKHDSGAIRLRALEEAQQRRMRLFCVSPCKSRRASIGSRPRATRCLSRRPNGASGGVLPGGGVARGAAAPGGAGAGAGAGAGVGWSPAAADLAEFSDRRSGVMERTKPVHSARSSSLN